MTCLGYNDRIIPARMKMSKRSNTSCILMNKVAEKLWKREHLLQSHLPRIDEAD